MNSKFINMTLGEAKKLMGTKRRTALVRLIAGDCTRCRRRLTMALLPGCCLYGGLLNPRSFPPSSAERRRQGPPQRVGPGGDAHLRAARRLRRAHQLPLGVQHHLCGARPERLRLLLGLRLH